MTTATSSSSLWNRLRYSRLRDVVRGRLDARLDWRGAIASAELPEQLAGVVTHVVRGTRLWRSEKVDVANDLIAHFQDGLDFGHTPDELLKTFGDPQDAARLIRRAKRRSRSLLWHFWHYGWMGLAALVCVYIAMSLWMSLSRPTICTDYLAVINKAATAVSENERAWPLYRDAMLALGMQRASDGISLISRILCNHSKPNETGWEGKEKFLLEHADSLAKLREATRRPNLGFVTAMSNSDYTEEDRTLFGIKLTPQEIVNAKQQAAQDHWFMESLLPEFIPLRDAAQLLADDARRAVVAGDGQAAYDNVVALLGISRHCQEKPFLVTMLVAESIQASARAVVHDILANHGTLWTDDQLRDLAHLFAAARTDWRRGLDGERMNFYDAIQRTYTDDGNGDGRLALRVGDRNLFEVFDKMTDNSNNHGSTYTYVKPGMAMLMLPAANWMVASRKEMIDSFDRLTDSFQNQTDEPYWKWVNKPRWDDELKTLTASPLGKLRYMFVDLLLPAYNAVLTRITISDGERDGLLIGLALELYHRQHGKWPQSLADLTPQYLPKLPVDSITGNPLHYKIVDDRPVVYSEGPDRDDDHGRPPDEEPGFNVSMPTSTSRAPDGDWIIWQTATPQQTL